MSRPVGVPRDRIVLTARARAPTANTLTDSESQTGTRLLAARRARASGSLATAAHTRAAQPIESQSGVSYELSCLLVAMMGRPSQRADGQRSPCNRHRDKLTRAGRGGSCEARPHGPAGTNSRPFASHRANAPNRFCCLALAIAKPKQTRSAAATAGLATVGFN